MNPPVEQSFKGENNSGKGKKYPLPPGVVGWSWGAFLLNWIWAIGNQTWIGLLTLIPYVGLVMAIILGFKGREWAWRNKTWRDLAHFNRVQHLWSVWGVIILLVLVTIPILFAIVIPNIVKMKSMGVH